MLSMKENKMKVLLLTKNIKYNRLKLLKHNTLVLLKIE